jgi:N-6 DNA Methylase/Eco57I restriction-modification methylase
MLPGIRGSLIASSFLEDVLLHQFKSASSDNQRPYRLLVQWWRRVDRSLGPASSPRAVLDVGALPLVDLLGYEVLHLEPHGAGFVGTVGTDSRPLAVLRTTGFGDDPDLAWRDTVRAGRTSGARWGLIYTGRTLRVIDAARTWSRRALDFELGSVVDHRASTTALWGIAHCSALEPTGDSSALENAMRRSDTHALTVCDSLGDGVLDALDALISALDGEVGRGRPSPDASFQHSLTLVYRLLFLLFAEARALVPTWNSVYRDSYSVEALWRPTAGRHPRGLWKAFQAMSRLAHAGCRAGDFSVTPFNGRLFSPAHTPHVDRVRVSDAVVSRAVLALATSVSPQGRRPISYVDLGVEQLGTVYERVLEYEPTRSAGRTVLTRTSHERKRTGSFYTPRSMTEFLVRRTLHPLVVDRTPDEILALKVVDPAMGSGAFLVAACRYLAAAAERALAASGEWPSGGDVRDRRVALRRSVAERCLYGVDRNPMAVQLARLSLWLTTLASDRPLTFLDHHLATGDSLIGAGFSELARNPARDCRRAVASIHRTLPLFFDHTAHELARQVLPERFRLAVEPGDTLRAVREKERALDALNVQGTPLSRWRQAADLWCAAWFPATRVTSPVFVDVLSSLVGGQSSLSPKDQVRVLGDAATVAREHHFFHWGLEFPEVFFDREGRPHVSGGFDAVIGNPPWDTLRADSGERDNRSRERASQHARLRFFREAGVFRHQGSGHLNRYQLFVERALQLTRSGGRMGLVLPSGLATDRGSGPLRRALLDQTTIDRLLGFSNRDGIFPIHRDVKFLLLTTTKTGRTERLEGSFGRTQPSWLDDLPDGARDDPSDARGIVLNRVSIDKWDPEHVSIPLLSSTKDLDLLVHASASVPTLGGGDGWGVQFGRELNATEDRPYFVSKRPTNPDLITVIEGKHLEPFRVRSESARLAIPSHVAERLLDRNRTFGRYRIAYRDVASATNRLTLIAAMLPPGIVSTHTVFCQKKALSTRHQYCLLALLNSLVANFLVRQQVTTHVSSSLMLRLPVPHPRGHDPRFRDLARLAQSLARTGVDADEQSYVQINSISAALYGLTTSQYEHVVGTFPLLREELRRRLIADYDERGTETRKHGI